MAIEIIKISNDDHLNKAFELRKIVFVDGQKVPEEEEFDKFEEESIHFLATYDGSPCGAARWRFAEQGVKLERFAVLSEFRGRQVGSALVEAVIDDIKRHKEYTGQQLYLNAQMEAMPLYSKFGFEPIGDMFLECDIKHMKMIRTGVVK